jgi:hypothetical protein
MRKGSKLVKLLSLIIPTKSEFENTVDTILKSTEYRHLKNPLRDFIDKAKSTIKNWFLKWIEKTFSNVKNPGEISDTLSTIFMIIGILVILAIIVVIVLKINKGFERKRRVKEILGEKIDARTTPQSLRQKAADFIQAGDLRQAVRYDFIALLLLMHEKNLVYLDETKTNEEIYKYLKKNEFSILDKFKNLIDNFNFTWYGHKELDMTSYGKWNDDIKQVWNEVLKHEA